MVDIILFAITIMFSVLGVMLMASGVLTLIMNFIVYVEKRERGLD